MYALHTHSPEKFTRAAGALSYAAQLALPRCGPFRAFRHPLPRAADRGPPPIVPAVARRPGDSVGRTIPAPRSRTPRYASPVPRPAPFFPRTAPSAAVPVSLAGQPRPHHAHEGVAMPRRDPTAPVPPREGRRPSRPSRAPFVAYQIRQ